MSRSGRRPTTDELALWRLAMGELLPSPSPRPAPAPPREPQRMRPQRAPVPPAAAIPPAELDAAAWREALAGVVPLHGTVAATAPSADELLPGELPATAPIGVSTSPRRRAASARSAKLDPRRPVDLDRRSWLMLRRGRYPIDTRLDLHGLTQAEAHALLARFLLVAAARGTRCVLVITGRGVRRGGALRAMTPRWLDEPPLRPRILAYAPARQEHGGDGALYVLLRRSG